MTSSKKNAIAKLFPVAEIIEDKVVVPFGGSGHIIVSKNYRHKKCALKLLQLV